MEKLILFDIDGTLVKSKFENKAELFYENLKVEAIKNVFGINVNLDWKLVSGKTDLQIFIEMLKSYNLEDNVISENIQACLDEMIRLFKLNIDRYYIELMPGARTLLDELVSKKVILGLLTGNLKEIALLKMEMMGIEKYFSLGGFGDDNISRNRLIKIAIDRAVELKKIQFRQNVYYFGDTPRDIIAGKKEGVITIGVATGLYNEETLSQNFPDFVISNFNKLNEILNILSL